MIFKCCNAIGTCEEMGKELKHERSLFHKIWQACIQVVGPCHGAKSMLLVVEYLSQSYDLYMTKLDSFVYSFVPLINIY